MSKFLKRPKAAIRRGRPPKAKNCLRTSSSALFVAAPRTTNEKEVVDKTSPGRNANWGKKQALFKKKPSKRVTRSKAMTPKNPGGLDMNRAPKNLSLNKSSGPNIGRLASSTAIGNGRSRYESLLSPSNLGFENNMETLAALATPSFKSTVPSHESLQNEIQTGTSSLETGIEGAQCLLGMKGYPMPFTYDNRESPLTRLVREPLLQYSPEMVDHNNNVFTPLESKTEFGPFINFSRPSCVPSAGTLDGAYGSYQEDSGRPVQTFSTPRSLSALGSSNQGTTYAAPIPFKPVNVSITNGRSIAISPMGRVLHGPRSSRSPRAAVQQGVAASVLPASRHGGSFTTFGINQAWHSGSSLSSRTLDLSYSLNPLDELDRDQSNVLDFNGCTEDNGTDH